MKLVVIPPYRGMNWTPAVGHFMLRELIDRMQQRGQLKDVKITIDEGYAVPANTTESRDAAIYADIAGGFLSRIAMYSTGEKYDAILCSGGADLAFHAARIASKIPVVHAALHLASFVGNRCSIVASAYQTVLTCRHSANDYGLGQKLIGARFISYSSTRIAGIVKKKQTGGMDAPDLKKLIADTLAQCTMAIEDDRVDTLLLVYPGLQCFEEEIRHKPTIWDTVKYRSSAACLQLLS